MAAPIAVVVVVVVALMARLVMGWNVVAENSLGIEERRGVKKATVIAARAIRNAIALNGDTAAVVVVVVDDNDDAEAGAEVSCVEGCLEDMKTIGT